MSWAFSFKKQSNQQNGSRKQQGHWRWKNSIVNMKFSTIILCLLIAVQSSSHSIAQEAGGARKDKYRAVHWGLDQGLSQAETYFIIKDVNGFLWVGTQTGLNRFDGSRFKIYLHDPQRPSSL